MKHLMLGALVLCVFAVSHAQVPRERPRGIFRCSCHSDRSTPQGTSSAP